jgi:hypothetical protein
MESSESENSPMYPPDNWLDDSPDDHWTNSPPYKPDEEPSDDDVETDEKTEQ